jgi:hypothetical protein
MQHRRTDNMPSDTPTALVRLKLVDWCRINGVSPSSARKARDQGLLATHTDAMGVERLYVEDGEKFLTAGAQRHVRGRAAQLQKQAQAKEGRS